MKQTICVDFDGVLHSYESGWQGIDKITDRRVPGSLQFLLKALHSGYDVAVLSARSCSWRGRRAMRAWLKKEAGQNLWYESPAGPGLESVRFPRDKPNAEIYIDDRGYRFTGNWPDLDEIMAWKPWNKGAVAEGIRKARRCEPPTERVPFSGGTALEES